MCSWEEENLSATPSGEPAYGMKIRLNFTASVSVSSPGGGGEKKAEGVGQISGSVPFVLYYENSSCEAVHVFWVVWLDLFHCTWQFTLGFFGRVSVFFRVVFAGVDAPFPAFLKKCFWFVMLDDLLL